MIYLVVKNNEWRIDMAVVTLSKEAKNAYDIFKWLREKLPNADICTLRHIGAYVAVAYDEIDIKRDINLILSVDKMMCNLLLNDGSEIRFENNSQKILNFIVDKRDGDIRMTLSVCMRELNNLHTAMVYGEVISSDWSYIISLDNNEDRICFIKTYYQNKLIENGTSSFKAIINKDIGLDCIDGLGYLTDIMVKMDLLYNNVRSVEKNKLVLKKCI